MVEYNMCVSLITVSVVSNYIESCRIKLGSTTFRAAINFNSQGQMSRSTSSSRGIAYNISHVHNKWRQFLITRLSVFARTDTHMHRDTSTWLANW